MVCTKCSERHQYNMISFFVDLELALPTKLNSSHLLFEKLLKAYNCAQECEAYQFFHVTFTEQVRFFVNLIGNLRLTSYIELNI